jgi:hypothetical protein
MFEDIPGLILAAGALGTSAFGIVEGLKWLRFVGQFGFVVLIFRLGKLTQALEYAYGRPPATGQQSSVSQAPGQGSASQPKQVEIKRGRFYTWSESDQRLSEELWDLLRAQYRGDHEELARILRQGVRIGLTPENAEMLADDLRMVGATELKEVARKVRIGEALTDNERNVLGRFELAADTRIEAALTLAQSHFKGKLQLTAAVVAILIALLATLGQFIATGGGAWEVLGRSLLIGILAVPVAPITHDIVDALKAITGAVGPKS